MKKFFTLIAAALMAATVNAQDWKAQEAFWFSNANLFDNDYATVSIANVSDEEGFGTEQTEISEEPKTVEYAGMQFDYYLRVRAAHPTESEPTGGPDGDNKGVAIVVKAKKNTDVSLYYKIGTSKELSCYDQTTGKQLTVEETIEESNDADTANKYCIGLYRFQGGHTYTVYSKGGTTQLHAISTAEGTYVAPAAEEYTVKSDCTGEVQLTNVKITFLDNTSKGSTAGVGTWAFSTGKAAADQNSCEIKFEPTASGKLIIYFQAKLANNKPLFMFVDGDTDNQLNGKRVKDDTDIIAGADHEELAANEGVSYMLEAGKTYNFYANGTKYAVSGFSYEAMSTDGVAAIAAEQSVNAPVYNLAGQQVDASYKGVVIKNGQKLIQK